MNLKNLTLTLWSWTKMVLYSVFSCIILIWYYNYLSPATFWQRLVTFCIITIMAILIIVLAIPILRLKRD